MSMSSTLNSQTSKEHDELVKYEYNLASCYEAEYLLSLKLQEDMICTSSESYDDGYEVRQETPSTSLVSRDQNMAVSTAGSENFQMPHTELESMETDYHTHFRLTAEQEPSPFTPINIHSQSDSQSSSSLPDTTTKDSRGCLLMGDMGNGYSHSEGPSRKRICLKHPEY